jgi:hypothetical protein
LLSNFCAAAFGVFLMLFALANSLVTLAGGHYGVALLTSLSSAALSLCFMAVPFYRGPLAWRMAAIVLASPALFVASDFLRRAPFAFGGG